MPRTGQELLEEAIEIDLDLETISDVSDKKYVRKSRDLERKRKQCFRVAVDTLAQDAKNGVEGAWVSLITALRFFNDVAGACPMVEGTAIRTSIECSNLKEIYSKAEEAFVLRIVEKAERLYKKASSDEFIPYQFRNKWLEKAIRMIMGLNDPSEPLIWKYPQFKSANKIYQLLANCYLKRGLSILPKGKGVSAPEKKLEAMRKALDLAEIALDDESSDLEIHITRVHALYELYRMDEREYETKLIEALRVLNDLPAFHPTDPFHYFILSLYCRFNEDPGSDSVIFNLQSLRNEKKYPYLPLIRAQAGVRLLGRKDIQRDDFLPKARSAVNKLARLELFSLIWEDTISFIKEMRVNSIAGWQKLALIAWQICRKKEQQMGFGLQIRQYWSRLSDLYAMAYEGAMLTDKTKKAVNVVDSLKGRTSLTWGEMDAFLVKQTGNMAGEMNKWRKRYYTGEAQANMGGYYSAYTSLIRDLPKKFRSSRKLLPVRTIPPGWAAVHLYLEQGNNGELKLNTLAGQKDASGEKNSVWHRYKAYDAKPMWDAYQEWLKKYRDNPINSAKHLDRLCQAIGKSLPFLFDIAKEVNGLILVPHGFTHLLPLHAAKNNDNHYLFEDVCSVYLPAWSLAPAGRTKPKKTPEGKYCLYHADPKDTTVYAGLFENDLWNFPINMTDKSALSDLNDVFSKSDPPEWLSILCHGQADTLYPFNSKLMLGKGGISFLELQLSQWDLRGSKVLLGACETELTPVKISQLDEHLSLAGAFLNKGAEMVMGSLWECDGRLVRELIESALEGNEPLWKVIQAKQKSWFTGRTLPKYWTPKPETFAGERPENLLYYVVPFRVLGYPFLQEHNNTHDLS